MNERLPVIEITSFSQGERIVDSMRRRNEKESYILQCLKDRGFSNDTIAKLMKK